jgi:hypothetical protein
MLIKISFLSTDLFHFALSITNKELNYDDYHVSSISQIDLKYLALAILNKNNYKFDEALKMIKIPDLRLVAKVIKNNETYIKAHYVSQIEYGVLKAFALALNWRNKEEGDSLVKLISDEKLQITVLAINNNETRNNDKWITKLIWL